MKITIRKVTNKKELKKFVKFPELLYKGSEFWIPPLRNDEYNLLERKKNPAFNHCEAEYFLAYRRDELVGRVAAIINKVSNEDWNIKTVRFGWMDFIDDIEVSKALLEAVATWGRERGMEHMKGPLGFTDLDKEGLLVDGFDKMPSITTIYNYPYYVEHFEKLGFVKDVDWLQSTFPLPEAVPSKLEKYNKIIKERYGLKIYKPTTDKELTKKGIEMFNVMNKSFSVLYEYSKLSDDQIIYYLNQYIPIIRKNLLCLILNSKDEVVAFAVTMPTLSRAFQKAKGRLFPFGIFHLLKAMKKADTLELYNIGIVPEYQNKGLHSLIFDYLQTNAVKYGIKNVVSNPQLETNNAVLSLFSPYKPVHYQRRRCYTVKL